MIIKAPWRAGWPSWRKMKRRRRSPTTHPHHTHQYGTTSLSTGPLLRPSGPRVGCAARRRECESRLSSVTHRGSRSGDKRGDPEQASRVAGAIDALSANSGHETKTQSDSAFAVDFLSQFVDIGLIMHAIMGAVFFTLMLLTGNTMAQAVRERTPELAVLKTLGFSNGAVLSLVLAESVVLVLAGGVLGLGAAALAVHGLQGQVGSSLPMMPVGGAIWLRGAILMVLIGMLVGALPARRGMRLRIVDALAGR
jgi:predicted lysophospholipase L1 biosynthesis ABC-type transport system permease subunit